MPFDSLIRHGVALADSLTASLQPVVSFEAWTGQDAFGAPTYAAAIPVAALTEQRLSTRQTLNGKLVPTVAKITILRPLAVNGAAGRIEPIDNRDRFTLPDGTTGPVVDVADFTDPDSGRGYFAEVWLGSGAG